jgi:hypothetical protein
MRNHIVDAHHFDAYPDSTYHPDADPDADFYYYLMRNRIQLFTRIQIQIQASK